YNSELVAEPASARQTKCIVWKVEKEYGSFFTCSSPEAPRYSHSCLYTRVRRRLWRRSPLPVGGFVPSWFIPSRSPCSWTRLHGGRFFPDQSAFHCGNCFGCAGSANRSARSSHPQASVVTSFGRGLLHYTALQFRRRRRAFSWTLPWACSSKLFLHF